MASETLKLPPAEASESNRLVSNRALQSRWSDLAASSSTSSSAAGGSSPALSLPELSEKLAVAHAKLEYQGQLVNSMQAKVCIIEKEMKRLIDENDYLLRCVQDPDFPERQRSRQLVQQLRQLGSLRKAQSGQIQPVYRPT